MDANKREYKLAFHPRPSVFIRGFLSRISSALYLTFSNER